MPEFQISNTTISELPMVVEFFNEVINLRNKNGYKVWGNIDKEFLAKDIESGLQFKIVRNGEIICLFSIQYNDPFIWRERDQDDAIYLHRIVTNPNLKGQRLFETVLTWTIQLAKNKSKKCIRMDTWAENYPLIDYYKSFGFVFVENYKTDDSMELPVQNRNLDVALLEFNLDR